MAPSAASYGPKHGNSDSPHAFNRLEHAASFWLSHEDLLP
jgi:hypothetical protein